MKKILILSILLLCFNTFAKYTCFADVTVKGTHQDISTFRLTNTPVPEKTSSGVLTKKFTNFDTYIEPEVGYLLDLGSLRRYEIELEDYKLIHGKRYEIDLHDFLITDNTFWRAHEAYFKFHIINTDQIDDRCKSKYATTVPNGSKIYVEINRDLGFPLTYCVDCSQSL